MASLPPGAQVRLQGLQSRPELNDKVGVVLRPESSTEEKELAAKGRVRVYVSEASPNLSLKPSNLAEITYEPTVDWSLVDDSASVCMRSAILSAPPQVLSMSMCHDFNNACRQLMAGQCPPGSLEPHCGSKFGRETAELMRGQRDHALYFLSFDQVGHHCVVEAFLKHGKARVFQCYVRDSVTISGQDNGEETGYTLAEWLSPDAPADRGAGVKACHERFGGGREVGEGDFLEFLELLCRAQELAARIAEEMFKVCPIRDEETRWYNRLLTSPQTLQSPLHEWTNELIHQPHTTSIQSMRGKDTLLFSNGRYKGPAFQIKVPHTLADEFREVMVQLTGCEPATFNYWMILHFLRWKEVSGMDLQGRRVPEGWAIHAVTIPH